MTVTTNPINGSPATAADSARAVNCPHCWVIPGKPCTVAGLPGSRLARYLCAERGGLPGRQALAAVIGGLDVIAGHVIIPDVTR